MMRRILVPLDGTDRAAAILSDARRAAGPHGTLILIRDASSSTGDGGRMEDGKPTEIEAAKIYLDQLAGSLREEGYSVLTQVFVMNGPNAAIDEAIRLFQPDMVACATHARFGIDRLVHGSVAWEALSRSPVPMLLRHAGGEGAAADSAGRRILVPLDGSQLAESALPLAEQLALEWNAELCLARAVPWNQGLFLAGLPEDIRVARTYLEGLAAQRDAQIPGRARSVRSFVLSGPPVEALATTVREKGITDLVLASHGRTGLARLAVGSVADGLIHHVRCSMVIVPALAVRGAPPERVHAVAAR